MQLEARRGLGTTEASLRWRRRGVRRAAGGGGGWTIHGHEPSRLRVNRTKGHGRGPTSLRVGPVLWQWIPDLLTQEFLQRLATRWMLDGRQRADTECKDGRSCCSWLMLILGLETKTQTNDIILSDDRHNPTASI